VVLTAMRADEWNRNWLIEGTTPSELLSMPEGWTPSQIREFKEFWDTMMAVPKERRKMRFVPGGSKVQELSRREQEFSELEMHLIRRTCSVYGVSPTAIGFEGSTYKVSQETANTQTAEVGISALLELRTDILNTILQRMGLDFLHCVNQTGREEAAKDLTDRLTKAAGKPYMTINEVRQEAGLDPVEGGDELIPAQEESGSVPPGKTPKAGLDQEDPDEPDDEERLADLQRWKKKALRLLKAGDSPACSFVSRAISDYDAERVMEALEEAETEEDILRVFDQPRDEKGRFASTGAAEGSPSPYRGNVGKPGISKLLKQEVILHEGPYVTSDKHVVFVTKGNAGKIASSKPTEDLVDAIHNLPQLIASASWHSTESDQHGRSGVEYDIYLGSLKVGKAPIKTYRLTARRIDPDGKGERRHLYHVVGIERV